MSQSTPALEVKRVSKRFGAVQAVDQVSFEVAYGEIFGLLGPNGAGKTTTIRMVLDILKPETGGISLLGGPLTEAKKARIGYLPEERGLYEDMKLFDTLVFLGQLKGLSRKTAEARGEQYLHQVDLWEARERKISALSRGMNQKAQFVAATLHEPDLIIVDEPFSGLDPVNTRLVKDLIYGMRDRGAAIIMSTHQMNQVEEMCTRILLMNHGRQVLYGPLGDIRARFAPHAVEVDADGELPALSGVEQVSSQDGSHRLVLKENARPEDVLRELVQLESLTVRRFEQVETSLDEIFIKVVGGRTGTGR